MFTAQQTDSFTKKYAQYSEMIFRIGIIYLGNKQDAEEVTQDVFIKLLYHAPTFTSNEHEKAWLIHVTTNRCKDILKSKWRRSVIKITDFERYYSNKNELSLMEDVVRLEPKYKDVIYLYYFENYTVKEIAQLLNIGISAVKMRLQRGRHLLKLELEDDGI